MVRGQQRIPGTENKVHKDITKAAEKYREARNRRMEAGEEEVELRGKLIEAMKKHEIENYTDDDAGIRVELSQEDKVKVRTLSEDEQTVAPAGDREPVGAGNGEGRKAK